jgi:hypothetical protein
MNVDRKRRTWMGPDVWAGLALVALGCFSVTAVIVGVRRRERTGGLGRVPPPDPAHARAITAMADDDYDLVMRGGAWVNGLNVTWPYASLLIGPAQAELRVYAVDEPIRVGRDEEIGLRWRYTPLGLGLTFRTESGRLDKVTFWFLGRARKPLDDLGWR